MTNCIMTTPFADPRTGTFYLRRAVPDALRAAFGGRALVKVSLRTKDAATAKAAFARENAGFEERLGEARRQMAEGTLIPTPAALVRRWFEDDAGRPGLTGAERLVATLMELDAAVGVRITSAATDLYPPPTAGPAANTDWGAIHADHRRYETVLAESYDGDPETVGSNWIRARWFAPEPSWRPALAGPVARLRAAADATAQFSAGDLTAALLATLDASRGGDEDANRARLASRRVRAPQPRLRTTMRLGSLFAAWHEGTAPRPQSALEYKAAVNDFIDFAGDVAVATIDADMIYDHRDAAATLPATKPRADRLLPIRARVDKHTASLPKVSPSTLKKRVGALQALLTYAFQQRWLATNAGVGIKVVGYSKHRRTRRSFEDHELTALCACPLFTAPSLWTTTSRISDLTLFWISLVAMTTGARLEEVGQAALADVKRDGEIVYLDIDDYALVEGVSTKAVKTDDSVRLVPIHARLIALGFLDYCDALASLGHTELFPDLTENRVGKRTKAASQRIARIIDRHVSTDRRLVFHSLRHAFKAKGNDAGLPDRTLDQICGHAPISTGGRYGAEPRIRTIHQALHQIDFSCVDWNAIAAATGSLDWSAHISRRSLRYDR